MDLNRHMIPHGWLNQFFQLHCSLFNLQIVHIGMFKQAGNVLGNECWIALCQSWRSTVTRGFHHGCRVLANTFTLQFFISLSYTKTSLLKSISMIWNISVSPCNLLIIHLKEGEPPINPPSLPHRAWVIPFLPLHDFYTIIYSSGSKCLACLINNFPSPISDVTLGNSDLAWLEYSPANGKVPFRLGMAIMWLSTSLQVFSDKSISSGKRTTIHAHHEMRM